VGAGGASGRSSSGGGDGGGFSSRLAASCQTALLGRTLKQFGGVVQVIAEVFPPFRILSVSSGWQQLCGYTRDEVIGRPLMFTQGARTEPEALGALSRALNLQMAISVRLTCYAKSGLTFVQQLSCEPLRDPKGETRCFQATSLVLRAPGELLADSAAITQIPLVSNSRVPPLWSLLGRTVMPEEQHHVHHVSTSAPAHQSAPRDGGRQGGRDGGKLPAAKLPRGSQSQTSPNRRAAGSAGGRAGGGGRKSHSSHPSSAYFGPCGGGEMSMSMSSTSMGVPAAFPDLITDESKAVLEQRQRDEAEIEKHMESFDEDFLGWLQTGGDEDPADEMVFPATLTID
jgi:PAS domain S-box-containing protein